MQNVENEQEPLRADIYVLLARLLAAPPSADLLEFVGTLKSEDNPLGHAIGTLATAAQQASPAAADDEYHALFVGLNQGEVIPYASHYLTGSVYGKILVELRQDMARLGVARNEAAGEPEDHIAILCEVMAGLILGTFGEEPAPLAEQRRFFEAYLDGWAPGFFRDIEGSKSAALYKAVGGLGALFMEFEHRAFAFEA